MKYTMDGQQTEELHTPLKNVKLPGRDAKRTWEKAHVRVLRLFRDKVTLLGNLAGENYLILASGGSSHHPFMQRAMRDICDDLGVPREKLIFTDDVDMRYS